MTPERWRRIEELFDRAYRLEPSARGTWLREVCDDDTLRIEVERLLSEDDRADRDGFLTPPGSADETVAPTGSWPSRADGGDPRPPGMPDRNAYGPVDASSGFTPRPMIALKGGARAISEPRDVVRARLRELPVVYLLMMGILILWRRTVYMDDDLTLYRVDAMVIGLLAGIIALLSTSWPISLNGLKALELGIIGMLAGRITFGQYRLMLEFSLKDDAMMAQLTMKNVVLLTAILILTYGLYVPKSWRRAALVVWPLALLPFATLAALDLLYPDAMDWLWRGWRKSTTPRVLLFGFDGMILLMLAVGSTFGARAISRLRREVAEARQLGMYRLGRHLGTGGMGEVYLAEHQLLKRPCALKLIRPGHLADPRMFERFEREVRLTATLSHPNTIEIFDYGRTEEGTYYYVMELLPGLNLAELVQKHGPLPPGRAVYLLRQVCGALREAHAAGLIHRDIKPSNIFAARRGGMDDVAKLLDFGLVLPASTSGSPHLSEEGKILGTPLFMSPEQVMGGNELDARSDIYSLGAVAYYLLTGRPPFNDGGAIGVMIAHARDPVVPPSEIVPGLPEDLDRVVLRCLSKDPASRYPDASSVDRALAACACAPCWDQERAAEWWQETSPMGMIPAMAG